MINYDWYTANYWHVAVYATLSIMETVDKKPFTFNWSYKNRFTFYFFNFWDNFILYGTPEQSIKIRDCPRQSGTYGMYEEWSPVTDHLLRSLFINDSKS